MAAPQQHALNNTSSTLTVSPVLAAAVSTSAITTDTYGSGVQASCDEVYSRLSAISVRSFNSSPKHTGTVHHPQPRPLSRRPRPCSLCGPNAIRSLIPAAPTSPQGPLEQPVVLLHRLEDGLLQGDVRSLRAYGTIRLLPVHSPSNDTSPDDYKSVYDDTINERQVNPSMARYVEYGERGQNDNTSSSGDYNREAYSNGDDISLSASVVNSECSTATLSESVTACLSHEATKKGSVSVKENEREAVSDQDASLDKRIHSGFSGQDLDLTRVPSQEGYVGNTGTTCDPHPSSRSSPTLPQVTHSSDLCESSPTPSLVTQCSDLSSQSTCYSSKRAHSPPSPPLSPTTPPVWHHISPTTTTTLTPTQPYALCSSRSPHSPEVTQTFPLTLTALTTTQTSLTTPTYLRLISFCFP